MQSDCVSITAYFISFSPMTGVNDSVLKWNKNKISRMFVVGEIMEEPSNKIL